MTAPQQILSPAPTEAEVPVSEIERVFRAQRANRQALRDTTGRQRADKLRALREVVIRWSDRIIEALDADLRKPPLETQLTEIAFVAHEAKYAAKHVAKWMKPMRVGTPLVLFGTRSEVRYEPKGVALVISPWNYPLNLALGPLVGAIAAGCPAILKPSEYTPHTSRLMQELLAELFPEDELAVFQGDHRVAQALLERPFDHIFFTGSPAVGRIVMRAAAEHLASVTLELGGKSPTIVDQTADLDDAAKKLATGKFSNCGQICVAPDYLLVHDSVHDRFVDALRERIEQFYGVTERERAATPHLTRIVSERHRQRLRDLTDNALEAGARASVGGPAAEGADPRYLAPTVLTDVPADAAVMTEEIFGPVLPVIPFATLDEAIEHVNAAPNPLALYVFSTSDDNVERVLSRTTAGGTAVNEMLLHYLHPELPFGGAGSSGIGKAHGRYSFLEFSNQRAVLRRTLNSPVSDLLRPPYTDKARKIARWVVKYL